MSEEITLLDAVTVLIERGIYKDREASTARCAARLAPEQARIAGAIGRGALPTGGGLSYTGGGD